MNLMFIWLLLLFQTLTFVVWSVKGFSNPCAELKWGLADDFPIEMVEAFKGISVSVGRIPYNSTAFKYWRSRSKPWIPDSAFLWHFYTKEQVRTAGGWAVMDEAKSGSITTYPQGYGETSRQYLREHLVDNKSFLIVRQSSTGVIFVNEFIREHGSLKNVFVTPRGPEILERETLKANMNQGKFYAIYAIDRDGIIYIMKEHGIFPVNHPLLCNLIAGYREEAMPLTIIDLGTMNGNIFSGGIHVKSYRTKEVTITGSFRSAQYLQSVFGNDIANFIDD